MTISTLHLLLFLRRSCSTCESNNPDLIVVILSLLFLLFTHPHSHPHGTAVQVLIWVKRSIYVDPCLLSLLLNQTSDLLLCFVEVFQVLSATNAAAKWERTYLWIRVCWWMRNLKRTVFASAVTNWCITWSIMTSFAEPSRSKALVYSY